MANTTERRLKAAEIPCGFCATGNHAWCPGAVRNGVLAPVKLIVCPCTEVGCERKRTPHCLECQHYGEVSPDDWRCLDLDACQARIEARLNANPRVQQIRLSQERADMAKATAPATKTAAAPKVGKCLVTGQPTKGGMFLPGMDARYVSDRVKDVVEKGKDTQEVRARIAKETNSESLVGKFNKGVAAAQERARKASAKKAATATKKAATSKTAATTPGTTKVAAKA